MGLAISKNNIDKYFGFLLKIGLTRDKTKTMSSEMLNGLNSYPCN